MALYPIEKVLRGEVTGTDTVLSICHFDSSEQREAVCQAGEEGPRQYKGSRNGQEKDEGNIYGDHSVGLTDFLDMGRVGAERIINVYRLLTRNIGQILEE